MTLQPTGPNAASTMPFSELGELTGVPNQAQPAPSSLPSVPQLKAKSALGAFAAQRVAGLASQALDLVQNALAAGRRGGVPPRAAVSCCTMEVVCCYAAWHAFECVAMHLCLRHNAM